MKLLSFLGSGQYAETTYTFGEKSYTTPIIQRAICEFLPEITDAVLFTTETAYSNTYASTVWELEDIVSCRHAMIPDGRSEDELWEIFRIISGEVSEGDRIVFDITHGFRSLPFISFLVAAYLRSAGKVDIERVLYGTFDPDRRDTSPVLELTPFVELPDWIAAAHAFTESMDARKISSLIREINDRLYKEGRDSDALPTRLKQWSNNLEKFTTAVRMARPIEALDTGNSIFSDFQSVKEEIEEYVPALDPVRSEIEKIQKYALTLSADEGITWEHAEKQLALIELMNEKKLYLQSMTLAREWMITLIILGQGQYRQKWLEEQVRKDATDSLNAIRPGTNRETDGAVGYFSEWIERDPELKRSLQKCMGNIREIRNDLAHCGMRTNPTQISRVPKKSRDICRDLRFLFAQMRS
ncbi:MAG: TIGR02221 family CRISPR-associated protein [Methanoculleaceae archaeon]